MRRALPIALGILLCAAAGPAGALAQSSQPLSLGAGYQFSRVSLDDIGQNYPLGFDVHLGSSITTTETLTIGWVGEFAGAFEFANDVHTQIYSFLGGVRLGGRATRTWSPSVRGLIGFSRVSLTCLQFCGVSENGFTIGGVGTVSRRLSEKSAVDASVGVLRTSPASLSATIVSGQVTYTRTLRQRP